MSAALGHASVHTKHKYAARTGVAPEEGLTQLRSAKFQRPAFPWKAEMVSISSATRMAARSAAAGGGAPPRAALAASAAERAAATTAAVASTATVHALRSAMASAR